MPVGSALNLRGCLGSFLFSSRDVEFSVLHADTYFELGDKKWSVSRDELPKHWRCIWLAMAGDFSAEWAVR